MSFLMPSAPAVAPPPAPPTIEDTAAKEQEQADRLRRRKGRAAAILDKAGTVPQTASKQLLGQ